MPEDLTGDLAGDEWPVRTTRRGVSMRRPTAILLTLLVAAGAFWGGAAVQRSQGGSTSGAATALASRFRALVGRGTSGASGFAGAFGGGGAASTAAATGTITVVDGATLYVTEAGGSIVEVMLGPSTKVTRDAPSSAAALRPGDSVVVEGSTSKSGAVSATSVAATAAGTSAPSGGFAASGAGASGAGASGASSPGGSTGHPSSGSKG